MFFATSESFYHGNDLGPLYACLPCDARVGAHRDTLEPMGRLANKLLRALKIDTHEVFDPLWRELQDAYPELPSNVPPPLHLQRIARSRAYAWLAKQLKLTRETCHIAMFDDEQCRRTIEIITTSRLTAAEIRAWAHQGEH